MMNMNPIQFISLLKSRNPQDLVMSFIKNNNINDPMITQLVQYAEQGDMGNVTKIAENYFSQKGLNFDNEFNSFISLLK